ISIGSIAAEMATNTEVPHHFFVIAMVIYTIVSLICGLISLKSVKARRFIDGTPIVLIQDGKILYDRLKKSQMTVNSLLSECRYAGYFDLKDIDVAILETSGELSILPKAEAKPATVKDLGTEAEPSSLKANVIIDGEIMENNLRAVGKDVKYLKDKLDGGSQIKDVLLATLDNEGELTVYHKNMEPRIYKTLDKFE
ncbi:MAG: DUF421 domain-containing protein, partial [Corallococcus sp.]|nr:DUF421 domain-containing protein [Corallococcus sp.]